MPQRGSLPFLITHTLSGEQTLLIIFKSKLEVVQLLRG